MRYAISIFFLLLFTWTLSAQESAKEKFVSLGYFGNFLIQPGLQAGFNIDLKIWKQEVSTDNSTDAKTRSFFIRPQVTYFSRPKVHQNYALSSDFGYRRIKPAKGKYISWSIGLGYLIQSQVVERKVSLGDGSKTKVRENWNYFQPTINYEFGQFINDKFGWYTRYSVGWKLSADRERSATIYIGAGLNYKI